MIPSTTTVGSYYILAQSDANGTVAEALETCDRGYVLETGRVAMEGTHKTLMSDERVRRAYLGM